MLFRSGANIIPDGETSPMQTIYTNAIDEITTIAKTNRKVQHKRDTNSPYSIQNDMDIYKLSAQLAIINRDNIHSIGELEAKIEGLKEQYENSRQEFNLLTTKQDNLNSLKDNAEVYFELLEKDRPSLLEQLRIKMLKVTLERNNISSKNDLEYLKKVQFETGKKISALKNGFEDCKKLYDCYCDIADTYNEISSGDYISKLVTEKKKQKERGYKKRL